MVEIYPISKENPRGYPPPHVVDWEKKSDKYNHGELGHIGYRCGKCAIESGNSISLNTHGVDHWQDKQIAWQEECDVIMSQFQTDVAEHFPNHTSSKYCNCPDKPVLPVKPAPPVERSLNKKNE